MKKAALILVVLCFMGSHQAKAQIPGASEAILLSIEALNSTSVTVQKAMESSQFELLQKANRAVSSEWLQTYRSLETIYDLLQDFVCQTNELQLLYKAMNTGDCLLNLKYNMSVVNLQFSSDILRAAFLGKNLLEIDTGTRNQLLQGVIKALEDAMKQMSELKTALQINLHERVIRAYNRKIREQEKQEMVNILSRNRYHN